MNKTRQILSLLFFATFFYSCIQKDGYVREIGYYKSGEIRFKSVGDTINDIHVTTHYYKNKNPISIRTRVNGLLEGQAKYYYEQGPINTIETYNNNALNGPVYNYYMNGKLKQKTNFEDGLREGVLTFFQSNGELKAINYFHQDSLCFKEVLVYDELNRYDSSYITYIPIIKLNSDTLFSWDTLVVDFIVPQDSVISARDTIASILDSFYITANVLYYEDKKPSKLLFDYTHQMTDGDKKLGFVMERDGNFLLFGYMAYHLNDGTIRYYLPFEREIYVK